MKFHKEQITHFFYWLFKCKKSGLLKKMWEDPKDFDLGIFGWGATYQPKNKYVLIKTRRVIDQGNYNICQWCATTTCKEVDEQVDLSERSLICKGKQAGLISGNGFSNLDSGDKILKDWGIVEMTHFDNNYCGGNWDAFVSPDINKSNTDASFHKIASHWIATKRGDVLKMLDDYRPLKTAIQWWTGFNRGGGFEGIGYLMTKFIGWAVGGHCFACIGYILNFKGIGLDNKMIIGPGGRNVYVFQNSYSALWGKTIIEDNGTVHQGLFFSDMDFFDKNGWAFKTTLDTPLDVAHFIHDYDNMNVKTNFEDSIYLIKFGKKHKYSSPQALAKSGLDPFFVSKEVLDKVPLGDNIN